MPTPDMPDWVWFEGEEVHVDAVRYAAARGISLDDAKFELAKMFGELVPGIKVEEAD